jgi:hypothetical protein
MICRITQEDVTRTNNAMAAQDIWIWGFLCKNPHIRRGFAPYFTTSTFLISSIPGATTLMKYIPLATARPSLFVPSHAKV